MEMLSSVLSLTNKGLSVFLLVVVSVILPFPNVAGALDKNVGKSISTVNVYGLETVSEEEFFYMFDVKAGDVFDNSKINLAIKTAFLKGSFDDIKVYIRSAAGGEPILDIYVTERTFVEKIKVKTNGKVEKDLVREMFAGLEGRVFDWKFIDKASRQLKEVLTKRGFPDAKVVVFDKKSKRPYLVILTVRVFDGTPLLIKSLHIKGSSGIVKKEFKIKEGDVYDEVYIKEEIERVQKKLRQKGFYSLLTGDFSYNNKTGALTINGGKGVRLKVVLKNNTAYSDAELLEEMEFLDNNGLRGVFAEEGRVLIKSKYRQKGYFKASVETGIDRKGQVEEVLFDIKPGGRYKISAVFIKVTGEGSGEEDEKSLKKLIAFKKGIPYNPDILDKEKDEIDAYFFNNGYPNAKILRFESVVNEKEKEVRFEISIDKGKRYIIDRVEVNGNKGFSKEQILRTINIEKNSPFTEISLLSARQRLSTLYQQSGIVAMIKLDKKVNTTNPSLITLVINIDEKSKFFFGKTIVKGNKGVKWAVFKRAFKHKIGDPFNVALIFEAIRELYQTGLFKKIDLTIYTEKENTKNVVLEVEQANPGAMEYAFGYGSYEGFRGTVNFKHINLFGENIIFETRARVSQLNNMVSVLYRQPWFLGKHLPFTTTMTYENRREKSMETDDMRYRVKKYSVLSSVEKEYLKDVTGYLSYDFSLVKTYDVQPDVVLSRDDIGTLAISSFSPAFLYDSRDDKFYPKNGFYSGLSMKLATKLLMSETDFVKLSGHVNYYRGLTKDLTLAVSLRSGVAKGWRQTEELPIVERFFLGGSSTVRGYSKDDLGPKGQDGNPTGGNAFLMGNIEFRTKIYGDFGIVNFLDTGNLWQKIDDMDPTNMKYTTGFGIRYKTPVGPVRLDYGYKINRDEGEGSGAYYISLGQAF